MKIILTIALHGSVEISETRCSGYREAMTTWIGSVEQEYYKACTGIICEKLYGLVQFLQSYDLQIVTFFIRSDRCEVGMNIQSFDPFWSNPTIHILSWCPYIVSKTTIFNPQIFWTFFISFLSFDRIFISINLIRTIFVWLFSDKHPTVWLAILLLSS